MVKKKIAKKNNEKIITPKGKTKKTSTSKITKSKAKSTKSKSKKTKKTPFSDTGIVIVDDDIQIDKEKINEERRAYLEEARSQEATD